jgi:hypothetical protein
MIIQQILNWPDIPTVSSTKAICNFVNTYAVNADEPARTITKRFDRLEAYRAFTTSVEMSHATTKTVLYPVYSLSPVLYPVYPIVAGKWTLIVARPVTVISAPQLVRMR